MTAIRRAFHLRVTRSQTTKIQSQTGCRWLFLITFQTKQPHLGNRGGVAVRALAFYQCVPGPGVICGLSLLFALFLAPGGFSARTPVFPSPQKPTFPSLNWFHPGMRGISKRSSCELLGAPWVNNLRITLHNTLHITLHITYLCARFGEKEITR